MKCWNSFSLTTIMVCVHTWSCQVQCKPSVVPKTDRLSFGLHKTMTSHHISEPLSNVHLTTKLSTCPKHLESGLCDSLSVLCLCSGLWDSCVLLLLLYIPKDHLSCSLTRTTPSSSLPGSSHSCWRTLDGMPFLDKVPLLWAPRALASFGTAISSKHSAFTPTRLCFPGAQGP